MAKKKPKRPPGRPALGDDARTEILRYRVTPAAKELLQWHAAHLEIPFAEFVANWWEQLIVQSYHLHRLSGKRLTKKEKGDDHGS